MNQSACRGASVLMRGWTALRLPVPFCSGTRSLESRLWAGPEWDTIMTLGEPISGSPKMEVGGIEPPGSRIGSPAQHHATPVENLNRHPLGWRFCVRRPVVRGTARHQRGGRAGRPLGFVSSEYRPGQPGIGLAPEFDQSASPRLRHPGIHRPSAPPPFWVLHYARRPNIRLLSLVKSAN